MISFCVFARLGFCSLFVIQAGFCGLPRTSAYSYSTHKSGHDGLGAHTNAVTLNTHPATEMEVVHNVRFQIVVCKSSMTHTMSYTKGIGTAKLGKRTIKVVVSHPNPLVLDVAQSTAEVGERGPLLVIVQVEHALLACLAGPCLHQASKHFLLMCHPFHLFAKTPAPRGPR